MELQNTSKSNNSYGLIDENIINNVTFGCVPNVSNFSDDSMPSFRIKDKPPIPAKKSITPKQPLGNISNQNYVSSADQQSNFYFNSKQQRPQKSTNNFDLDYDDLQNYDERDLTHESFKLTADEMKELDLSSDEDDDISHDEEENSSVDIKNESKQFVQNDQDQSSDNLELTKSEFVFKKVELENSLLQNIQKPVLHSISQNRNHAFQSDQKEYEDIKTPIITEITDNKDEDILNKTPTNNEVEKTLDNINSDSFYDTTQNITNNERINQLVMQSVERVKRFGLNMEADLLYNNSLMSMNNNQINKNLRLSSASIKTVSSNIDANILAKQISNITINNEDDNQFNEQTKQAENNSFLAQEDEPTPTKSSNYNQFMLDSKYFKPQEFNMTNVEDPSFLSKNENNNNPVIKLNDDSLNNRSNQMNTTQSNQNNNDLFEEFDFKNQDNQFLENEFDNVEFKSSNDVLDMLEKDEHENKKEFELSVNINEKTQLQSSGPNSSSSQIGGEKWWSNMNPQQVSKLELSNLSFDHGAPSTILQRFNESNTKKEKHKIDVSDYFNRKSDMPDFIRTKPEPEKPQVLEEATCMNENSNTTLVQSFNEEKTIKNNDAAEKTKTCSEDPSVTFTSPSSISKLANSFSFTLNSTGDFITDKKHITSDLKNKSSTNNTTTTPFQLTKALLQQKSKELLKSTNLKAIAEDLNRVSNRLASQKFENDVDDVLSKNEGNSDETTVLTSANSNLLAPPQIKLNNNKLISDPLLSSSIKSSASNSNLKSLINMDETVSSISSTNVTTSKKSSSSNNENEKNNSKTGSLTSTPSKMHKSKQQQLLDNTTKSSTLNQESFISTIPERNDSTLVGNHHNQHHLFKDHHHHHHHHSHKTSHKSSAKIKQNKNSEIQTCTNSLNSTSNNNNNNNNNDNIVQEDLHKNTRISSISNQTTPESTVNLLANQLTVISNLAASLTNANNGNNSGNNSCVSTSSSASSLANNTPMIPFTFLPAGVVMKYFEEMQSNLIKNSFEQNINSKMTFLDSNNHTPPLSTSSTDSTLTTISNSRLSTNISSKIELPEIVLDKIENNQIDFGLIAEGCSNSFRVNFDITNETYKKILDQKHLLNDFESYIQIEFDIEKDWQIEAFDLQKNQACKSSNSYLKSLLKNKYERSKLIQSLRLHTTNPAIGTEIKGKPVQDQSIKLDRFSKHNEFFISLITNDIDIFKKMIQLQENNSHINFFEPILVKTSLYIYYCVNYSNSCYKSSILSSANESNNNDSNSKRYLLTRIDLKYIFGYSRLRITASLNSIEFDLENFSNTNNDDSLNKYWTKEDETDPDRTLSSINEVNIATNDVTIRTAKSIKQCVSFSNAGNIKIDVLCSISNENFSERSSLIFKNYELRLNDTSASLESQSKFKSFIYLTLTKLHEDNNFNSREELENLINNSNTRLNVQIEPNGLIHQIPIKVKTTNSSIKSQHQQKNDLGVRVSTSKSILHFSKSLYKPQLNDKQNGLFDELTLKNLMPFKIKCLLTLTKSITYFKFTNEMKMLNSNYNVKLNESMNEIRFDLAANQEIIIKIRFDYDKNNIIQPNDNIMIESMAKLRISDSVKTYRFKLIGFLLNESSLNIENGIKIKNDIEKNQLDEYLSSRQIKTIKYSIEMINTSINNKSILRKVLNIDTRSSNSKCLLYPFIIDLRENKLLSNTSKNQNDFYYEINANSHLRLLLSDLNINRSEGLEWIELTQNHVHKINLELIFINSYSKNIKNDDLNCFQMAFFWVENDLNAYCAQNIKRIQYDTSLLNNSTPVDTILNKILNNTCLNLCAHQSTLNDSIISSKSSNFSFNQNGTDDLLNESRVKLNKDEPLSYLKLMRQSLKCSILKLNSNNAPNRNLLPESLFKPRNNLNENMIDVSLNKDESTLIENPKSSYSVSSVESWSIKPDTIMINDVNKNDETSGAFILELKNNLKRKPLNFDLKYSSKYLMVKPASGILEELETIKIKVIPTLKALNSLPWFGTITVWCNKIQKDVRITLNSTNNLSMEVAKRENQSILSNNNISTISLVATSSSSSTPYSHSISAPVLNTKSNSSLSSNSSLEQGTLQSDITQYTIDSYDSFSMTPLLNTTLIVNKKNEDQSNCTPKLTVTKPVITRIGTDITRLAFPSTFLGCKKEWELSLKNPTEAYVTWKAYSQTSASIKFDENNETKLGKSKYSVFVISPASGTIPPLQKQIIKIEFTPREVCGEYMQRWAIDTRAEINDNLVCLDKLFNCQLELHGKANEKQEIVSNNPNKFKLSEIVMKSKLPSDLATNPVNKSHQAKVNTANNSVKSTSLLKTNYSNSSISSMNTMLSDKSSLVSASILSSASNTINVNTTSNKSNKVELNDDEIEFENAKPNEMKKRILIINNRGDSACYARIINVMEPYFCKHPEFRIKSNHYIKIPIEFRPKIVGEYNDRILVRIEGIDAPLPCKLKGICCE